MIRSHKTIHNAPLPTLFMALGLALASSGSALATDLPVFGGPGGSEFRAQCPNGSYLVGFEGKTGAWVERISPVCAPWLRGSQTLGPPAVGQEVTTICRDSRSNTFAIHYMNVAVLKSANRLVQSIWAGCQSLTTSPLGSVRLEFGARPPAPPGRDVGDQPECVTCPDKSPPIYSNQVCPAGEAGVGIRGRAGQFVDAVGLICGPMPARLGSPATKLPRPLVQAPSPAVPMNPQAKNMIIAPDMFVITKPIPGQLIPHGKLIVTATAPEAPPTVGPPRYAELELRCLDAPANLQSSYPYFHVITVDEAKLRGGYSVKEGVTGACSVRWQVRARFSLNTATGPWSAAVPFGLCFDHCPATPPSAIQQTAPLPSSSIMQSAPSSQKSTSSSLMIRPRGIDGKAGKGGNSGGGSSGAEEKP
ncbi:MAG: hypothetical protein QM771_10740 [Nitrospira sp.]